MFSKYFKKKNFDSKKNLQNDIKSLLNEVKFSSKKLL